MLSAVLMVVQCCRATLWGKKGTQEACWSLNEYPQSRNLCLKLITGSKEDFRLCLLVFCYFLP